MIEERLGISTKRSGKRTLESAQKSVPPDQPCRTREQCDRLCVSVLSFLSRQAFCAAILLRQRRPPHRMIRIGCDPIRPPAALIPKTINSPGGSGLRGERFGPGALP